jgi:hypothetical protein
MANPSDRAGSGEPDDEPKGKKLGGKVIKAKGKKPARRLDKMARGGKLTYQERKNLPKSDFIFPAQKKYPIPDASHARNALARVAQHGTPEQKTKVKSAVHRKYPSIEES